MSQDELQEGYIKVQLDYAPKTNGKKMREWCDKHGFAFMGPGRRAWCGSLGTYLRGASGVAYADGEPFLFYEEDLVDIESLITAQRESWEREARMDELGELGYQTATNGWHKGKASLMWKYIAERQAQLKAESRKESENA